MYEISKNICDSPQVSVNPGPAVKETYSGYPTTLNPQNQLPTPAANPRFAALNGCLVQHKTAALCVTKKY